MTINKTQLSLTDMSPTQFRHWLLMIVNESLFTDRDELDTLLAQNADRKTLEHGFRNFFEAYYYNLAFELDTHEECLFSIIKTNEEFSHLRQRMEKVENNRNTSPIGRQVRMLGEIPNDSISTIKINSLPDNEFRMFIETLVNSELFTVREQVVKLMKEPTSTAEQVRLQSAFYDFFVCHLELEQFLESYEYDPDEGLEIRPKVAEQLDRSIADYKSGKVKGRSLKEVAEKLEVEL